MGYKKGKGTRKYGKKRAKPRPFRPALTNLVQIGDRHPSSQLVRLEGNMTYFVKNTQNLNSPAVIVFSVSDLLAPYKAFGTWQENSSWNIDGLDTFREKYRHYFVLGARVTVNTTPIEDDADTDAQPLSIVSISRQDNQSSVNAQTTVDMVQKRFGSKCATYSSKQPTIKESRMSIGYSPKKQFGIKDVCDSSALKVSTAGGMAAPDRTFVSVYLNGMNSSETYKHHQAAMVRVKVSYLAKFVEPVATNNDPTGMPDE